MWYARANREVIPLVRIIAGCFRGRVLDTPTGCTTRPTGSKVREALFSMVQPRIADSRWLDLFAGSGAIGIEALSRGAVSCLFVDNSPRCCRIIRANLQALAASERGEIRCGEANALCRRLIAEKRRYDFVFADPPYDKSRHYQQVMDSAAGLLAADGLLILEHKAGTNWQSDNFTVVKVRQYGDSFLSLLSPRRVTN